MDKRARQGGDDPLREAYARLAPRYDRKWSFYIEASTRETLIRLESQLRIDPGARIADIGCGTGVLLGVLAQRFPEARLIGIDPVAEMLAQARARLPARVELIEGWAEALPIDEAGLDLVISCNALHFMREPRAALEEMHRVLRPGGPLVITDWCDDYLVCRICDRYLRLFDRAHVKIYGERECLEMLRATGFTEAHVERYKITWLWGLMTALARKRGA